MSQIFSESRHEMPNHFRGSQEFSRHRVLREERMVSRTIFPVHGEKPSVMLIFLLRGLHTALFVILAIAFSGLISTASLLIFFVFLIVSTVKLN